MTLEPSTPRWRKSSRSSGQGGACVELACSPGAVRDSKSPAGPVLAAGELAAFLKQVKRGRFDTR